MKSSLSTILISSALALAIPALAQDAKAPTKEKAPSDAYPLKTCVVSDEPLGSMGDTVNYTHREAGKPDRVVKFCCDGCVDDFKKEPAKFLAKLDAAAKDKSAPAKKPDAAKSKGGPKRE